MGTSSFGDKITDFLHWSMDIVGSDIIGKRISIIKNCFVGEGGICPELPTAFVWHDIYRF